MLIFMMMSTLPFYYITLEEYYLGKLLLPAFSGPDDTSLAIMAICFYTAYKGPDMFLQEADFFGLGKRKYADIAVYIMFAYEIITCSLSVISNLYSGRNCETF